MSNVPVFRFSVLETNQDQEFILINVFCEDVVDASSDCYCTANNNKNAVGLYKCSPCWNSRIGLYPFQVNRSHLIISEIFSD